MTYTMARQAPEGKPDMVAVCRLARELGMDGMDQVHLYDYPPQEIRRIADDHGIPLICYTFSADLNFPDAESRKPGLEAIREGLDAANILGAPTIMLPIGGKEGFTRGQSRANVIEGLKDAVKLSKTAGVKITTEHFVGTIAPFLVSADMNEAVAEVPDLYVTYDNGNVLISGEDPIDGFLKSREKIIHAHFKDFRAEDGGNEETAAARLGLDGNHYRPALIGEGLVDYPSLLRTMTEAGYDGYINIEYEGDKYPADQAVKKALDYLRKTEANL